MELPFRVEPHAAQDPHAPRDRLAPHRDATLLNYTPGAPTDFIDRDQLADAVVRALQVAMQQKCDFDRTHYVILASPLALESLSRCRGCIPSETASARFLELDVFLSDQPPDGDLWIRHVRDVPDEREPSRSVG